MVTLWVLIGVAGVAVLGLPTLRLWHAVRTLGREVRRVSADLSGAAGALADAGSELGRARSHTRG